MVKKILFITLSNIGDVILSLPALDVLRENFPQGKITVIVSPRPKDIFEDNPGIDKVVVFNKNSPLKEKIRLFNRLKKEGFDIVVDLRNSFFGAALPARYRVSPFSDVPKNIRHMKERYLYKVKHQISKIKNYASKLQKNALHIKPADEKYIEDILEKNNIAPGDKLIVIAAGARSHIKRWPKERFAELAAALIEKFGARIILAGDSDDAVINKYITQASLYPLIDLSAKTSLNQLACLLNRADLLITNDSAVLHLASYLDRPVLAIFGPTNEIKYGPWSKDSSVVKKDVFCRPCEKAQCRFQTLECMRLIKTEDVLRQAQNMLESLAASTLVKRGKDSFKRILIVRTDKIGDVVLSTPVIKALRDAHPSAYIAMMVSPYTRDIVEGNPYLDEVIIYDYIHQHKSWRQSMEFARSLKKKRFDLAIILHPTNRAHLLTFFAAIPRRIGYDRKFGFLLTDRIKHAKQLGEKHELEYNLDLLKYLGIEAQEKDLFIPLKPESEEWVAQLFRKQGLKETDKVLAIHPSANCPSKIWPHSRFAEAADKLAQKYGFKVLIIAGPKDIHIAEDLIKYMHRQAINLAGKVPLVHLASLLKRCTLFISNDSGPVHIASAVGVPVIAIFGRSQKGLSPKRWGPRGKKDKILHKPQGCLECLAHNCVKEFACLRAITVEDVLEAADSILKPQ